MVHIATSEVTLSSEEAAHWEGGSTFPLRLAAFLNRALPRGKGAAPRFIGGLIKNRRLCVTTRRGARLAVHPGSMEIYAAIINNAGAWNPHILETCRSLLQPGQVFYDIGANIGFISIELERAFDGNLTALAFEPQPELSRIVLLSAKINGYERVRVFEAMLGDHEGTAHLFVGSHTIHASAVARETGSRRIERQLVTLDRFAGQEDLPEPDLIKIDIEGGELSALRGGADLIRRSQPHIVFESDENMARFGYTRPDLLAFLASLAEYEFFYIEQNSAKLIPVTDANLDHPHFDILARSRRRMASA